MEYLKCFFCYGIIFLAWNSLPAQSLSWSTQIDSVGIFASPAVVDLNGDGVKDVVIGAGRENEPSPYAVLAIDGANGEILWSVPGRDQIVGTPIFQDMNSDQVPEVFIGGRKAQFFCIDGATGQLLWEFWPDSLGDPVVQNWFNFYSAQWIPDQNADGYLDLVCSNGGDARVNAADTLRPAGKCLILSSLNGEMLGSISTPDQKETYFSPLLIESGSISEVILGTGGETVGGGVYKIPLDSLANNSAHPPERLVVNSTKGFVAVPSLGDFTKDGIADLAIPGLKESIYVLDGQSFQKVWEITLPQAEHYVSPTIGEFTGDDQLDIFAAYGIGNWPFYQGFVQVLIDGADGTIMWQDTSSVVQFSSANALDWDNDGVDEVLFMDNYDAGFQQVRLTTQMVVRDFNDDRLSTIGPPRSGINFFSMPLIDDLEGDGKFEVVYMYQTRNDNWYSMDGARVERFQLPVVPGRISWGRYLGNQGNGYHEVNIIAEMDMVADVPAIRVYPNPTTREVHLQNFTEGTFRLLTPAGQVVLNVQNQKTILLGDLAPGVYPFILETSQGTGRGRLLIMRE